MMGIRDSGQSLPQSIQYHPHDVGPIWLEGSGGRAGISVMGCPGRVGEILIVPIFQDGDLE